MENGDKNPDDFHCMQMSLMISMRLFSAMTEITHLVDNVRVLAVWQSCHFPRIEAIDFRVIMHAY